MKNIVNNLLILLISFSIFPGCIDNDIQYPKKIGEILSIKFEGQIGEAAIDCDSMTVVVDFDDTVNMSSIRLLDIQTTDSVKITPEFAEYWNLVSPVKYELETYPDQQYVWTISGNKIIERYLMVENQVGEALFDVDRHEVVVYVSESQSLEDINVIDVKLGPKNAEMVPDPRSLHDFTKPRKINVKYDGKVESWKISMETKEIKLETGYADAWACHADLNGLYLPSLGEPSFQYRKKADSEWSTVPSSVIEIDGIKVTAAIGGLEDNTDYVYRIIAGDAVGNEVGFRTEAAVQMINMGFDEWIKEGKSWYPNADLGDHYWWDSGNKGANAIGEANPTSPEEDFLAVKGEGKKAARLETVSVLGLVMAGGNVFSGQYVETSGLGARVTFGRPFTSRPSSLKGYYAYEPKVINKAKGKYSNLMGRMDRFHIFVYVTDWTAPYVVDTNKDIYLDVNDPCVIGYGELVDSVSTGGKYKEFTLDIKYRNHRKPTYCAVVAVASYYADYFTGAIGSVMYVDEFSFDYKSDIVWEE